MSVWRYTAVPLRADAGRRRRSGEMAAGTASEVRSSLRRVGLQVVRVREVRRARAAGGGIEGGSWFGGAARALGANARGYLRRRRGARRAELYDSLATMLGSGIPLLEAVETLIGALASRSAAGSMLVRVRESLRSGASLGESMSEHPAWFGVTEVAMVRAAQHGGTLGDVLRGLADRHERSDRLTHKLAGALTYPAVVSVVGLGVVVFLSVNTLPDLVRILADSGIPTPSLTARVMSLGALIARHGPLIGAGGVVAIVGALVFREGLAQRGLEPPGWLARATPRVVRRMAVARMSMQLAELLGTGIPMVEALRVLAPTMPGLVLRRRLVVAAERVERGAELSDAFSDDRWFDAEFRRLLDIGQSSGELDGSLERIGDRYARQADRLIDRLATLLEPLAILLLACLIGVVVMAALLPLLRIQEML